MSTAEQLPLLPDRLRAMFCTKCGYQNPETEAAEPHAPCENSNCQYTALVREREFTAEQMQAYARQHAAVLAAENERLRADAERYRQLNTPEIGDFLKAVEREALHQRDRWGAHGDAGKSDADWFWLLGYLGGKAMHAITDEKRLHHIITTAAACLNWHAARIGAYTLMRSGIDDAAMKEQTP